MHAVRIETVIETDGELHLKELPWRKGDRVEVIVLRPQTDAEARREEALQRFLEQARSSGFRSCGPYPTRDELHERRGDRERPT